MKFNFSFLILDLGMALMDIADSYVFPHELSFSTFSDIYDSFLLVKMKTMEGHTWKVTLRYLKGLADPRICLQCNICTQCIEYHKDLEKKN